MAPIALLVLPLVHAVACLQERSATQTPTPAAEAAAPAKASDVLAGFERAKRPKLLILGTYHMANPGLDVVKVDLDDHRSPRRQREIAELVDRLLEFAPTKIAVEALPGNAGLQRDYQRYREHKHELTANEVEQVGFRLADRLDLPRLYPIDHRVDLRFDEFFAFTERHGLTAIKEELERNMALMRDHLQASFDGKTVLQILQDMNSEVSCRVNVGVYLRMLQAMQGDERPGAELASDWYRRNLIMLANVAQIATSPDDRVLVLVGAGHAAIMRSILRDSLDFEVIDTSAQLE